MLVIVVLFLIQKKNIKIIMEGFGDITGMTR